MAEQPDTIAVDHAAAQHVHAFMAGMRAHGAVCPVSAPRREHAFLVTRYPDVLALLADDRVRHDITAKARQDLGEAEFSYEQALMYRMLGSSLLYRDPPDHTRLRRLVNHAFTSRAVERLRPVISRRLDELLDEFDPNQPIDIVTQFGIPLTIFVICALFGIPDDEQRCEFWDWSRHLSDGDLDEDYYRTLEAARDYLTALINRKRSAPAQDLLSDLINMSDEDGDRLSGEELIASALLLLLVGHDTTVSLITNTILSLLTAPDQLRLLNVDHDLVANAIEEVLRYESPVNILPPRYASEPITVDGVVIPAGGVVLLSVASANRDDAEFPDPDRFDITRRPGRQLAFGHGIHYCPGAPLARLEAQLAVGALVTRFPNVRLVSNPDQLCWRDSTLMHGPAELLIRVD
jgi:cytochrome P450